MDVLVISTWNRIQGRYQTCSQMVAQDFGLTRMQPIGSMSRCSGFRCYCEHSEKPRIRRGWLASLHYLRACVMCEPVCELFFRDFARGQCPKLQYAFLSRRSQLKPVQTEECHGNSECGSLVSIDKWMVRNYSLCIAGGESRQ